MNGCDGGERQADAIDEDGAVDDAIVGIVEKAVIVGGGLARCLFACVSRSSASVVIVSVSSDCLLYLWRSCCMFRLLPRLLPSARSSHLAKASFKLLSKKRKLE